MILLQIDSDMHDGQTHGFWLGVPVFLESGQQTLQYLFQCVLSNDRTERRERALMEPSRWNTKSVM